MKDVDLSILIVSYGTEALLRECLRSLAAGAAGASWEAIVVDNHSPDGSADMAAREFPEVRLIRNEENAGYSKANNKAASMARGRAFLLLNPDARLEPGAGRRLLDFMDAHARAGAVGARIRNPDGSVQPSTYPGLSLGIEALRFLRAYRWLPGETAGRLFLGSFWDHAQARAVERITGACVLLRREAWDDVGPLSEDFFVYGSTHDWCMNARRKGWEIWLCPEAVAVHHGGRSTGEAWGEAGRRRRMLEAHDLLLRRQRGPLFASAWWTLALASNLVARLAAPFTGTAEGERRLLADETSWLGRRLAGGAHG